MEILTDYKSRVTEIIDLFSGTFATSEGMGEGMMIGGLVQNLLSETAPEEIFVFMAVDDTVLIGGAIFTKLNYSADMRKVFLLSPMAVAPDRQGQGIGQALLRHALISLRAAGVDVAMTYGDPEFYSKVGFKAVSEEIAPAPLPLSQPQGWIGQSLTEAEIAPFHGKSTCVAALNDPSFW